jgi:hypothetical protein
MAVADRKRPWYLVLALLGALALGTTGAFSGWNTVALYREPIDPTLFAQGISDEADRAAIVDRFQAYLHALDAAKSRAWPLAVAMLVLGSAVFVAAMRTLGGSKMARNALVQLVIAQGAAYAGCYWLTGDVRDADLRLMEASQTADLHEHVADRRRADEAASTASRMLRAATPIEFVLRSLGSALIVVALTRRRSRDFLESAKKAVEER